MTGMRARGKRLWRILLVLIATLLLVAWVAAPFVNSAALLMDMTGAAPGVRRWLPVRVHEVATRDLVVPTRHGDVPARLYRASSFSGASGPTLVIFPGVHGGGVDEPRLVALSRRIAATGATVLSVPLPDLRRYHVTPRSTDMIEDAILWTTADRDLAPQGRVGVVAVSFAGGLALVAAGRPSLSGKLTAVFALGAHADLPRVIRYLCLAEGAPKTLAPPHDYGVVLMLRSSVVKLVPADQAAPLDAAIVTFLDASSAETMDQAQAARLFAEARAAELTLPEPSRTLMHGVNERDVRTLGRVLAPLAEEIGGAAALSPARSPATTAPVFLLHGSDDNVIPASESIELERYLTASGNTQVDLLLTPLVSHAAAKPAAGTGDLWRLVKGLASTR
jgi:pimeloyl-ACP methyl ester carboxylesterase